MFMDMKLVKELKEQYKEGMVVELIHMDDSQAPAPGTRGVIQYVDDIGQIGVKWETGSTLSLVYGEDSFKIV